MAMKLKGKDLDGFDPDELDVEWDDTEYESYDGEQPPSGTSLRGYVKKLWWTVSSNNNPMLKVLWIAAGNTGKLEEYNGLPIWDQVTFTTSAAFRYGPFLQVIGVTLRDIYKNTYVADEDDSNGAPIERIGKWSPGEDAECGVITKREKYEGEWRTKVQKWVEPDDTDDEDDDDDEEEAPTPRRRTASKPAAKPAASRSRRKPAPEPEDDDEDDEEDEDEEQEEAPKPARRTSSRSTAKPTSRAGSSARSKPAAKTRAPAKSRGRSAATDNDEDPF